VASATQQTELATATRNKHGTARSAAITEHLVRFGSRLAGVLNYASFEYECLEIMQRTVIGERQPHTCSYDLCIGEGISLGEIIVSRATPFRESELLVLETCLSDLCLQLQRISQLPD
jgi:hypothetical protein